MQRMVCEKTYLLQRILQENIYHKKFNAKKLITEC